MPNSEILSQTLNEAITMAETPSESLEPKCEPPDGDNECVQIENITTGQRQNDTTVPYISQNLLESTILNQQLPSASLQPKSEPLGGDNQYENNCNNNTNMTSQLESDKPQNDAQFDKLQNLLEPKCEIFDDDFNQACVQRILESYHSPPSVQSVGILPPQHESQNLFGQNLRQAPTSIQSSVNLNQAIPGNRAIVLNANGSLYLLCPSSTVSTNSNFSSQPSTSSTIQLPTFVSPSISTKQPIVSIPTIEPSSNIERCSKEAVDSTSNSQKNLSKKSTKSKAPITSVTDLNLGIFAFYMFFLHLTLLFCYEL